MLILCLLIAGFSSVSHAQSKKYQGLLWKISGNGLEKPSYIYGTMHVSDKLAFNVSDAFYNCLEEVDAICLESSPEGWMEEYRDMGAFAKGAYSFGSDFYNDAFDIQIPGTKEVYTLLENKNSMMNQILYRYNPGSEDYQENTYLDMFIYQAGAKYNKPVYSLENLSEVIELTLLAMTPDKDKKNDNSENSYLNGNEQKKFMMLEEAYRRGDLDQIDSLSKSDNPTEVYHQYFIVERNRNMIRRMDSLMQTQSVFTGIGAAHLPGKEGAIELLREKGYTVEVVSQKTTKKSHKMRKKFAQFYRPVAFKNSATEDQFIQATVPGLLYEMPTGNRGRMEYLCPEPINGGYYSVIRLFTYGPLFERGPDYYQATFDSLLYIATPGELLKKEDIVVNGHKGYNILTQTSKNSLVNYRVFFTPTEVVIFKGSGNGRYIEKSEPQSFFTGLKLKTPSKDWSEVSPKHGGAKWKMKGLVTGQDAIDNLDDTEIFPCYQSYDQENDGYFLVMKYNFQDLNYIEEDSFDLAYLGKSFAENIGYEIISSMPERMDHRLSIYQELQKKKGNNRVYQKLIASGANYYIMVTTAPEEDRKKFFNSFSFDDYKNIGTYEAYIDSSLSFSVNTIKKDVKLDYTELAWSVYRNMSNDKEDRSYLSDTKNKNYANKRINESVHVSYIKFHDYDQAVSEEDFWEFRTGELDDDNLFILSRREHKKLDNGDQTLSFLLTDTNSTRGILTKFHMHAGVLYTLQSVIDTVEGATSYVETFFNSFEPLDTAIGRTVFERKADIFFENALGTDSLARVNAIKSIAQIDFEKEDIPKLIETYNNFEYSKENESGEREDIIMAMGDIDSDSAYQFLIETFDKNSFDSDIQFIILKCLSYTESQTAYDAIKKLMLENTPVTDNYRKFQFFNNLYDSLELAQNYFPDLLDLAVSYPEYKPYLIELLAWGHSEDIFAYTNFKDKKDWIQREALIELKRAVADQEKNPDAEDNNYYGTLYDPYHTILLDYYTLMLTLKNKGVSGTEKFFEGIEQVNDERFHIEKEIVNKKLGHANDTSRISKIVDNVKFRAWTYNRLYDEDLLDLYPEISQEELVKGLLYYTDFDPKKDTVAFVEKRYINNGEEHGYVYFFKRKREDDRNWMIDYAGIQPSDGSLYTDYQTTKWGLAYRNEDQMTETIDKAMDVFKYMPRKRVIINTGMDWNMWSSFFNGNY